MLEFRYPSLSRTMAGRSALLPITTFSRSVGLVQVTHLSILCSSYNVDLAWAVPSAFWPVQAYFVALGVACAMALLLLAPMANLKSYTQRESLRQKRLKLKSA